MDFGRLSMFEMLTRRMGWLNHRQQVLAQNVANVDTPEYKPRDLKEIDFQALVKHQTSAAMAPVATHKAHLAGPDGSMASADREQRVRQPYETTLSGNAVVLEEQLLNLNETQIAYQTMTGLYRKQIAMIKTALGRAR